jgi:hypothetical protein
MPMFRAVPKEGFDPLKIYAPQATRRMPSNVPFVVDNVWEWLRPGGAPSRRQAVYASPTPAGARASASAVGGNPEDYVVCELEIFSEGLCLAHLKVADAREHSDIGVLMRYLARAFGSHFSDAAIADKLPFAALYLPAVSGHELGELFASSPELALIGKHLRSVSTFWQDASLGLENHNGELFFEMQPGEHYRLHPLE